MLRHCLFACFSVCLLFLASGCDGRGGLSPVSGTVTLDGAPLPEGDIIFAPVDTKIGPEAGKIKDGKYELKSHPGSMKVQITASKILPGAPKGAMGEDVATQYIPVKYNDQSTLTAEVKPGGENKIDFPLESK